MLQSNFLGVSEFTSITILCTVMTSHTLTSGCYRPYRYKAGGPKRCIVCPFVVMAAHVFDLRPYDIEIQDQTRHDGSFEGFPPSPHCEFAHFIIPDLFILRVEMTDLPVLFSWKFLSACR